MVLLDDLHFKWAEKEMLKNWADKFPFVAEIKGGSMTIRPEKIVVTSNYHPAECFGDKDLGPILRRFKVVTMDDLPPAPPKQKKVPDASPETPQLDDMDESEFDLEVLPEQADGGQGGEGEGGGEGGGGQEGGPQGEGGRVTGEPGDQLYGGLTSQQLNDGCVHQ